MQRKRGGGKVRPVRPVRPVRQALPRRSFSVAGRHAILLPASPAGERRGVCGAWAQKNSGVWKLLSKPRSKIRYQVNQAATARSTFKLRLHHNSGNRVAGGTFFSTSHRNRVGFACLCTEDVITIFIFVRFVGHGFLEGQVETCGIAQEIEFKFKVLRCAIFAIPSKLDDVDIVTEGVIAFKLADPAAEHFFADVPDDSFFVVSEFFGFAHEVPAGVTQINNGDIAVFDSCLETGNIVAVGIDFTLTGNSSVAKEFYAFNIVAFVTIFVIRYNSSAISRSIYFPEDQFIDKNLETIRSLGFEIVEKSNCNYEISAVPLVLANISLKKFVDGLLLEGQMLSSSPSEVIKDKLAQSACKHAIKGGDPLSKEQILYIIEEMKKGVLLCPHGRPIVLELSKKEIEKMFKRIV